jgi:hypothetical protein
MGKPGVYVLITPGTLNPDRPRIYIGEADVLEKRIGEHDANREEWSHVIAFASLDGSINKAHAKNLESRLVALAQAAGRAEVENKNVPQAPALREPDTADVESFLSDMLVIYALLGLKAFEPVAVPSQTPAPSGDSGSIEGLVLRVGKASAQGALRSQGFVVFKGAIANLPTKETLNAASQAIRLRLIEQGIFVRKGDAYELLADQVCTSPSQAAELVMGYPVSGLERWTSPAGTVLRDILAARSQQ